MMEGSYPPAALDFFSYVLYADLRTLLYIGEYTCYSLLLIV